VLTTLYGLADTRSIPRFLFAVGFAGIVVATSCYLFTEFALRPVAAQALEAGPPPRRLAVAIMGRLMTVWLLGSAVPILGIVLAAMFTLSLRNLTTT
jgi:adenylate cyclase